MLTFRNGSIWAGVAFESVMIMEMRSMSHIFTMELHQSLELSAITMVLAAACIILSWTMISSIR